MATTKEFALISGGLTIRGNITLPSLERRWPLVVLCHGIPSGLSSQGEPGYEDLAERIAGMGAAACRFNFRGTGSSDGNFSLPGWVEDLSTVLRALGSQEAPFQWCDPGSTALIGFSGGGAVAIIYAASNKWLKAIATLSSPSDFTNLISRQGLPTFIAHARAIGIIRDPDFPPSEEEYYAEMLDCSPANFVAKVSPIPLLLVHGDEDDMVPVAEAYRLYDAAREPKELFVVNGGGHRLRLNEEAMDKALSWMKGKLL